MAYELAYRHSGACGYNNDGAIVRHRQKSLLPTVSRLLNNGFGLAASLIPKLLL